ncbi:MAG: hypothetical protein AB1611_19995 [bacterium]
MDKKKDQNRRDAVIEDRKAIKIQDIKIHDRGRGNSTVDRLSKRKTNQVSRESKMKEPFAATAKTTAKALKRTVLDDIYTIMDEVKHRQEEDSRFFNNKIDSLSNQLNQRIDTVSTLLIQRIDQMNQKIDNQGGELRQEIGAINQRIDNLGQKLDAQIGQVGQKLDTQIGQVRQEISQLNHTILQFLMTKQKE